MPRPKVEYPDGRKRAFPTVSKALQAAFDGLTSNGGTHHVTNREGKCVLRCWRHPASSDPFLDGKVQWLSFERLPPGWN